MRKPKDTDAPEPDPGRARYMPRPVAANDPGDALACSLTGHQLAELTAQKLLALSGVGGKRYDDKNSLACRCRASLAQIDNLRKRGLPVVMVGSLVRFDFEEVDKWLRRRKGEG